VNESASAISRVRASAVTRTMLAEAVSGRPMASGEVAGRTDRSGFDWWLPVVVVCSILLCLPFLRTFFALDDEGVLLYGADRMLQGKSLYGDFFEFLPPGGFVITALWFSLTGVSVLSARALAILVIAGIAGFTYLTCRRASRNAPLSAVLTVGWVVMSQGLWTQVNHHWLTTLFSITAAWAAFVSIEQANRGLRWPLMAGVAAGMAAMITPTCGALAMLATMAAFVWVQRRKRVALSVFVLGGLVIPVCLIGYLVWRHVFVAAFDDVILFTARRYAPIQVLPFGDRANAQDYPLMMLFPISGVLWFLVCARDWRACLSDRLLWLAAALGLAGFVGSFPRADVAHIAFNAPLALPLLALGVSRLAAQWRPWMRHVVAAFAIMFCLPSALVFASMTEQTMRGTFVPTPRGNVALFATPGASEIIARIAALPAGDKYFFYPFMPTMPFLTVREDVSIYDVFTPGYTLPSQYREACIAVLRHADWVVVDTRWTDPTYLQMVFPAMRDARPHETAAFEEVLDSAFALVAREGTFELRHRRDRISETACVEVTRSARPLF
jgi:hypothetical protein